MTSVRISFHKRSPPSPSGTPFIVPVPQLHRKVISNMCLSVSISSTPRGTTLPPIPNFRTFLPNPKRCFHYSLCPSSVFFNVTPRETSSSILPAPNEHQKTDVRRLRCVLLTHLGCCCTFLLVRCQSQPGVEPE